MNLEAYLARIGMTKRPPATLAGLRAVQRSHLYAVPYENFDVQLARPSSLDPRAAFDKIVNRLRGGWCYEMNGVLGWALGELGFQVTRTTGAVFRSLRGEASVGNHLVLRVDLPEGVFLADAGFGDGPVEPIRVRAGSYAVNGFTHRVEQLDDTWWRMTNHPVAEGNSFDFTITPADESVLGAKCRWLQLAPESNFVLNAVAQRCVPGGVRILRGRTLRFVRPDAQEDRLIASADDLVTTLARDFALDLPEAAGLWPRIVARHEAVMAERAAAAAAASNK